ncbi:hypothetical protein I4F81_012200 [Pyropia yezoensis]|uniref:Uncharacterized protein n=1 Tax=Pyropia yezoensis TaxID=2788 RepID=A0ACC3CHF4_PYRYE|nr:hypothetical protein I4F81_012200 [Neopyropia yezoensis]|eukprot:contig_8208_g1925
MTSKRPRSVSPGDDDDEDEITPVRSRGAAARATASASNVDEDLAPVPRKRRGAPEGTGDLAGDGGGAASRHADGDLSPEVDDAEVELEMADAADDGDDDDDEEDDAVLPPVSAARPPKSASRARVAATQDDWDDDDDEDCNEDLDGSEDDSMAGVDSSTVAQRTADALAARFGSAQVGILDKVRVENFLCHDCFEFEFGPNINIINGQNRVGQVGHCGGLADWAGRQSLRDGAGAQD